MLAKLSLRERILSIVIALAVITLCGGLLTLWYAWKTNIVLTSVIEKDVSAFRASEELESALMNQKGFTTYYLQDGDEKWLAQLEEHEKAFAAWLKKAEDSYGSEKERDLLKEIHFEYEKYAESRQMVIDLYRKGELDAGKLLRKNVSRQFLRVRELCEKYKDAHSRDIAEIRKRSAARFQSIRAAAVAFMLFSAALFASLTFMLVRQVLNPIRKLTLDAAYPGADRSANEVRLLKNRVRDLMENADKTRTVLEKSREMLLLSEKMAAVGKLAAEVAHSIRNPMTSIKMRLFSLERGIEMSKNQKEDFDVITEEMSRLDRVLNDFLEFSRPPKLKKQRMKMTPVFDAVFKLLGARIEKQNVRVTRNTRTLLPAVDIDPELMKDVLVNIICNALDVMPNGGELTVHGEEAVAEKVGRALMLRIKDTGPGIPAQIQDRITEPFFSTKNDGTGLGLATAVRIINEHGGRLDISSVEGAGAVFTIVLPLREDEE